MSSSCCRQSLYIDNKYESNVNCCFYFEIMNTEDASFWKEGHHHSVMEESCQATNFYLLCRSFGILRQVRNIFSGNDPPDNILDMFNIFGDCAPSAVYICQKGTQHWSSHNCFIATDCFMCAMHKIIRHIKTGSGWKTSLRFPYQKEKPDKQGKNSSIY